jgi:REP element-mobilizing transposase RayT
LIGAFKTVSTKHINLLRNTDGQVVWQRNYYEHIIRNERDMDRIHRYIESNPSLWADDDENPNRVNP